MQVFVLDEGEGRLLDTPACCEELAGVEQWRTTVWGSAAVRALGARFVPALADGDLDVRPDQVPEFIVETKVLRANLATIVAATDLESASWRLANIQIAGGRALGVGGGLRIW